MEWISSMIGLELALAPGCPALSFEHRSRFDVRPGSSRDVMMERSYDVFNFDIFEDASGIKDTIKFHLQYRNRRLNEEIRLALGAKIQSIQASPFFLTVLLERNTHDAGSEPQPRPCHFRLFVVLAGQYARIAAGVCDMEVGRCV